MSKPEWTKMGNGPVEYCIGTGGVIGVYWGTTAKSLPDSVLLVICSDGYWSMSHNGTKAEFEAKHCQPPKPRHIIREYADGSCVVESTDQDEQGLPLRAAIVRHCGHNYYVAERANYCGFLEHKTGAIARAIRYAETGE